MRKMKKLLSLVLSLVMVVSLLQGFGAAKVNAASELEIELAVGNTPGIKIGSTVSELIAKKVSIAGNAVGYSNVTFTFNNGKYNLDPDDVIEAGTAYSMTIKFDTPNANAFNGVSKALIGVYGKTYDSSLDDKITGTVTVKDTEVTIKASLKAYPKQISWEQLGHVAWNLVYNNTADTTATILDAKNAQFTAGKIAWYYSSDTGKTRKSVTRIDATANGGATMYIMEVKLTAKDGYCFREYTKDELAALKSTFDEYKVTLGSNKKEAILTVSGLVPMDGYDNTINSITDLIFETQTQYWLQASSITDKSYARPSDVINYCTQSQALNCFVGIKGGQPMPFTIDSRYRGLWKLVDVNGRELTSSEKVTAGGDYYLVYPLSTLKGLMGDQNYKYVDTHNLFSIYEFDSVANGAGIPTTVKTKVGGGYWAVKVAVIAADKSVRTPSNPYAYPVFTFNQGTKQYTAKNQQTGTELWTGITGKDGKTAVTALYTTDVPDSHKTVSGDSLTFNYVEGPQVYMAWGYGKTAEGTLSAPIRYTYYNPKEATSGTVTGGSITFNVALKPMAGAPVINSRVVYARNATAELMAALNTDKIYYFWSGLSNSGFIYNNGTSKFNGPGSYTLQVYIPLRSGFYVNGAKAIFAVGGDKNYEVTFYPDSSNKFMVASLVYTITDKIGFITSTSVDKKMYFNMDEPVSGATVQKNIPLTESSARFASFVQAKWFEDGKDFTGTTFTAGKRYEVEIRLNCSKGWISGTNSSIQQLVGQTKYCVYAMANSVDQYLVIRFNFGVCPAKKVKLIGDVTVDITNGVTTETFKGLLNAEKKVAVTFTDGTKENVVVKPGYMPSSAQHYGSFYDQFIALYPGDKGYNPNKSEAQTFAMYGNVDLTSFGGNEKNLVLITIKVGEGTVTVTFDANGGTYLGAATMKVKKGEKYGFAYVPSEIYREDYFFAGWYTEPEDGKGERIKASSICTGNITLYAHWLKTFTGMVWNTEVKSWSKGRLTVKWDQVKTKADGYEVSYSRDGKNWEIVVGPMTRVKFLTGLKSGKKYFVRVRAWRYDSTGKVHYGAWSKAASAKVK